MGTVEIARKRVPRNPDARQNGYSGPVYRPFTRKFQHRRPVPGPRDSNPAPHYWITEPGCLNPEPYGPIIEPGRAKKRPRRANFQHESANIGRWNSIIQHWRPVYHPCHTRLQSYNSLIIIIYLLRFAFIYGSKPLHLPLHYPRASVPVIEPAVPGARRPARFRRINPDRRNFLKKNWQPETTIVCFTHSQCKTFVRAFAKGSPKPNAVTVSAP